MDPTSFRNDSTRIMHVVAMAVISFLALIAVILRLWARNIQRKTWDMSDYLIVGGLVWAVALTIFTIYSNVYWDLGGNMTQVGNPAAIPELVKLQFKALLVGQITWATAVFFVRASILALYIRVFRTRSFRIACYTVHGFNAAFCISVVLAACLICRPISFNWDHTIRGGYCGDQKSLDLFIGIFNLFMDVTVVVLPMPVLWGLQMAVSKKIVLSAMFGLGTIICIITLVRIKITTENHGPNSQKVYSLVALFTCLEALLGVINACLPVMKPLFNKFASSKASSWLSSVMSGTILVFIRPSQMGSAWKSGSKSNKRTSAKVHPMPVELKKWPGSAGNTDGGTGQPPPPRYVDNKAAGMMFASSTYAPIRSPDAKLPASSIRPPAPTKHSQYTASPTKRGESDTDEDGAAPGIYVQKGWDIERGTSTETERELLRDTKERNERSRW